MLVLVFYDLSRNMKQTARDINSWINSRINSRNSVFSQEPLTASRTHCTEKYRVCDQRFKYLQRYMKQFTCEALYRLEMLTCSHGKMLNGVDVAGDVVNKNKITARGLRISVFISASTNTFRKVFLGK